MTARGRRGCAASLAALALVLTACTDDGPDFGDELGDYAPIEAERVSLDDGTELAVGSRGEHAFVVQWREADGTGWTEPETVVDGPDLEGSDMTVTAAGDSAVAGFSWYAEDDDERENYARTDAAACRAFACDVVEDVVGTPMVDADGRFAAVEMDDEGEDGEELPEHRFAVWEPGSTEWEEATLEGLPPPDGYVTPEVVLLGDGSFATVREHETDAGCGYQLWVSEPRRTTLAPVAATDPRVDDSCNPEHVQTDGTRVAFYDRSIDQDVIFALTDDGWADDLPESKPPVVDDRDGRGIVMMLTALEDGSSVAVGSPDGFRVVAQHRPADSREWTRPVTVARSPADRPCRMTRSSAMYERTDVLYVVSCWPRGSAWGDEYDDAPPPASGFALASADGRDWTVAALDRPAYEPASQVSERLLLARGAERSVVWRPGATEFEVVDLPLENPTVDAIAVTGDTAIRVTGNPDPARPCRPTWSVAPRTGTAWQDGGAILPVEAYARGPYDCYGVAIDEEETGRGYEPGREFRVAGVIEAINGSVDGTLERTAAGWRFRRG